MKTVRQRNMVNRETKLAIGEKLQTLFRPFVSATKQAADKTGEELAPVKKALEDIDGALKAQQHIIVVPPPSPPSPPQKDVTFGIHATGYGRNAMGNSKVHIEGNTLKVDDKEYELTPGLRMLILYNTIPVMIILYTKQSLHRPGLEPIQVSVPALLVHVPHGNGSICLVVWLYLETV